jgi:phosphoenolpyruvate carboxylase
MHFARASCFLQILAKADMRIVALYDQQLVRGEGEEELGRMLRQKFCETQEAVLQVRRCLENVRRGDGGRL